MSSASRSTRSRKDGPQQVVRIPARANRYTPHQREDALRDLAAGKARSHIAEKLGCVKETLRAWEKAAEAAGRKPGSNGAPAPTAAEAMAIVKATLPGAAATTTPPKMGGPKDPGSGLGEHEVTAILDYKKKHPSMGPAQIRAQLPAGYPDRWHRHSCLVSCHGLPRRLRLPQAYSGVQPAI